MDERRFLSNATLKKIYNNASKEKKKKLLAVTTTTKVDRSKRMARHVTR